MSKKTQEPMGAAIEVLQDQSLSVGQTDEVFAAGVDIGRLEAMDFIATIANSASLAIYENVKKSKAWRHLRHPESCDGRNFASLDEFCQVKLGRSYRRLQELAANRNSLGQEAYEQAERLGLRQVDYNAIKALPAPEQELMRRAVEDSQSRDEVLDVLQELAARTSQQRQALESERDELRAEHQATEALLAKKNEQIDRLQRQQQRSQTMEPDEVLANLKTEAGDAALAAEGVVAGRLRHAMQALREHEASERGRPDGQDVFLSGLLGQVQRQLTQLREELGLAALGTDTRPAWQQWADEQDALDEAAQAGDGDEAQAH